MKNNTGLVMKVLKLTFYISICLFFALGVLPQENKNYESVVSVIMMSSALYTSIIMILASIFDWPWAFPNFWNRGYSNMGYRIRCFIVGVLLFICIIISLVSSTSTA